MHRLELKSMQRILQTEKEGGNITSMGTEGTAEERGKGSPTRGPIKRLSNRKQSSKYQYQHYNPNTKILTEDKAKTRQTYLAVDAMRDSMFV